MKSETRARSFAKTLSYRVIVIALLAAVTYAFTGNAGETTVITLVFNAGGAAIYYGFERLWDAIEWGKQLPMLPLAHAEQSNRGPGSISGLGSPHDSSEESQPPLDSNAKASES